MAYRDDLEALNAQVRTLKAELEAAQQTRTAAQAAADEAARAAADEAALVAKRSGDPSRGDGGRRWMIIAISLGALALAIAGYLSVKLMATSSQTEHYHARVVRQESVNRILKTNIKALQRENKWREQQQASLAASLSIAQRRCQCEHEGHGQRGGDGQRPASAGGADPPGPPASWAPVKTLAQYQIQWGMHGVKGNVKRCYDRFKLPGLANVQVKIERSGRVSAAQVKGMFAGTPTGNCVQSALRRARFQRFTSDPITITYPFILR